jgi:hypothetical protein
MFVTRAKTPNSSVYRKQELHIFFSLHFSSVYRRLNFSIFPLRYTTEPDSSFLYDSWRLLLLLPVMFINLLDSSDDDQDLFTQHRTTFRRDPEPEPSRPSSASSTRVNVHTKVPAPVSIRLAPTRYYECCVWFTQYKKYVRIPSFCSSTREPAAVCTHQYRHHPRN